MVQIRRWALVLGWALTYIGFLPAMELGEENAKWRHYASENFELFSRANDTRSRDILWNLELLRALFVTEVRVVEREKTSVTVYCFGSEKAYKSYLPDDMRKGEFAAMYHRWPDRARIAMFDSGDTEAARHIIFHEYIHHLSAAVQQEQPVWLSEGLAELYASIKVEGENVEFGRPIEGRLYELKFGKLLPLDRLFSVRRDSGQYLLSKHNGLFYSQSWALMHYWMFGRTSLPKGSGEAFVRFATAHANASPDETRAAFESIFHTHYDEMLGQLRSYTARGSYTWGRRPIPKIPEPSGYLRREVPVDEMRLRLSELAVSVADSGLGRLNLLNATQSGTADPRPYETLGALAFTQNDASGALEQWRIARGKGSVSPAIERELLRVELRDWIALFDPDKALPDERVAELRSFALDSLTRDPEQTVAYETLAWVEGYARKPSAKNLNLVVAKLGTMRKREQTMLALALAYYRYRDSEVAKKNALAMLEAIKGMPLDEWTAWSVERLSALLEDRVPNFSNTSRGKDVLELRLR